MPLTPPAALISLIAIMVESCSDFSMIERPPVNEKRTPTLISPAACAPVWKTHGEVIAVPPASKPFLRNLRLSIAITPLPIVCGRTNPFAPKHVVQNRKISRADRSPKTRRRPRRFTIRKNKKARQTLAGRSGYLAGPDQQHRWSSECCEKLLTQQ